MDPAQLVRNLEFGDSVVSLMAGSPGAETLQGSREILLAATKHVLDQEVNICSTLSYGDEIGDSNFREELAAFLSKEYGTKVESCNLWVTAGATYALHMIPTVLLTKESVVFIEEPSYFAASRMLKLDLDFNVVPVARDADGIDTDLLDKQLTANRPEHFEPSSRRPFWGMVYMIPVFNNPTGTCYSPERCKKLIQLARKHDVLLLAEDVYNLIHFGDTPAPARLLSYDNPDDPDYKGHVLSNGTFSKILAPGLRLGWLEGPTLTLWSGGSPNHYAARLAAAALNLGLQTKHLNHVRQVYKKRCDAACKVLRDNLPEGASFVQPQGGFFIWVEFPKQVDTFALMQWMVKEHSIFFLPGVCASLEGNYKHCARISICFYEEPVLVKTLNTFCQAAKDFISQNAGL